MERVSWQRPATGRNLSDSWKDQTVDRKSGMVPMPMFAGYMLNLWQAFVFPLFRIIAPVILASNKGTQVEAKCCVSCVLLKHAEHDI